AIFLQCANEPAASTRGDHATLPSPVAFDGSNTYTGPIDARCARVRSSTSRLVDITSSDPLSQAPSPLGTTPAAVLFDLVGATMSTLVNFAAASGTLCASPSGHAHTPGTRRTAARSPRVAHSGEWTRSASRLRCRQCRRRRSHITRNVTSVPVDPT